MREIIDSIPDVEVLLELEPEELGGRVLAVLIARAPNPTHRNSPSFNGSTLLNEFWRYPADGLQYPVTRQADVEMAFTEAWSWLEVNGLIVAKLDVTGHHGNRVVSRRGYLLQIPENLAAFRAAKHLSRVGLHILIADAVWRSFIRGDYGSAVFQSMRAVEIAVREAGRFTDRDYGTDLMGKAFHVENGPLRAGASVLPEREALRMLFMGTIGSYKNPHSHRDVPLDDPAEAAEIILLANHLLRIVDDRRNNTQLP